MIARTCALALCLLALHGNAPARAQDFDGAREAYRAGRYDEAITALRAMKPGANEWTPSRKLLAQALGTTGKYDDAERVARQETASPSGRELLATLGDLLAARGKRAAAESAYTAALVARASDSLRAQLGMAVLHYARGQRDEASRRFRRILGVYNAGGPALSAEDLVAVATACQYLGVHEPQLFKDALRAFDEAIAQDAEDGDAAALLGELFLAKYNSADAKRTFDDVLERNAYHPRALVGEARRRQFDGQPGADSLVTMALAVNPDNVDALLLRAESRISAEQDEDAKRDIDRALRVNPSSVAALSLAAVLRQRVGDAAGVSEMERRVHALDATDASIYVTLADLASRTRRYTDAVTWARRATELDPRNWRAHTHLGMNQLRTGDIDSGQKSLAVAFAGDPYDVWVKNTLDLLDTFGNYETVASDHFRFMVEKTESKLMSGYLTELGERAYATFSKRYGYVPPTPIRLEMYRSHAEFSVRTVGLSGLGALGVSFGATLAMDSPAAKDFGPFNWGSTLWHEVAHTFTLGASDNRTPRWLSEGLSVYEEHRARAGWGFQVSPDWLEAFARGKLPPASRLNEGFVRPAYPQQVMFAYYEASLVCDFIAKEWGEKALTDMLHAYRDGAGPGDVLRRVLRVDAAAFDKRFDTYVRARFGHALAALRDTTVKISGNSPERILASAAAAATSWHAQLAAASALARVNRLDLAVQPLERAVQLFPEYAGDDGPYPLLVRARLAAGDTAGAVATLKTILTLSEADIETHVLLADLAEKAGDTRTVADALERSMYMNPYDLKRHERLATAYAQVGDKRGVVRERTAIVALEPVERAEAYYQLALAWREVGDAAQARRAVLRALADAPDFQRAQELLQSLRGGTP